MSDYQVFTSESVSEGHPDKVADQVSDAVLDAMLAQDPDSRVACETLCTTNRIVLAGEVRGPASITPDEIESVARAAVKDIGYEKANGDVVVGRAAEPDRLATEDEVRVFERDRTDRVRLGTATAGQIAHWSVAVVFAGEHAAGSASGKIQTDHPATSSAATALSPP